MRRRRCSELIGLSCGDLRLGVGAHVSCLGKGRKQRKPAARRAATNASTRPAVSSLAAIPSAAIQRLKCATNCICATTDTRA